MTMGIVAVASFWQMGSWRTTCDVLDDVYLETHYLGHDPR